MSASPAEALAPIQEAMRRGNWQGVESLAKQRLAAEPTDARAWFYLGTALVVRSATADAIPVLQKSVSIEAGHAHVWNMLATAERDGGQMSAAEESARRAVAIDSANALYWTNLGHILFHLERWTDASDACRQALSIDPQDAIAWENLAASQYMLGQLDAAQSSYAQGLSAAPQHLGLKIGLAQLLTRLGRPDRARSLLETVLAVDPHNPRAWIELGSALQLLQHWQPSAEAYARAIALRPGNPVAYRGLVRAHLRRWLLSEAEAVARSFVDSSPQSADAWELWSAVLHKMGRASESQVAVDRACALAPTAERLSGRLVGMQYGDHSPQELLAAHREWDEKFARHLLPSPPAEVRRARDKLVLGFVSADFGMHPTAFLALPAMEHLDKREVSTVCYYDGQGEDDFTRRFKRTADIWRPIYGLTDEQVADQIKRDEVDIMFDLMGHTGARMNVFARKPAPVQITWMGYVGTTGLAAMDYLLADNFHARLGEESFYAENVLRMPDDYICFGPPAESPPVGPLPMLTSGHVTFGCFNNPAKFSPAILSTWSEILRRLPDSRLLLKFGGLQDASVQSPLREFFDTQGVRSDRIQFEGWSPHGELLAAYHRVDIALDTQPYSGGLTTCEALWMGVPVITCPGPTFAGRHSTSHLSNAGFPEFIAADLLDYIDRAIAAASQPTELAATRAQMRAQVAQSPLCDAQRFANAWQQRLRVALASRQ